MEENKQVHDSRVSLNRQTGSLPTVDTDTAYNCLNRMRKRSSHSIPGNHGGDSFTHALDSAEGVEIFTCVEFGDQEEVRVILKNIKEDWQQNTKFINAPNGKGFVPGHTVTWQRLNMRWLIVRQDYNYGQFFKGEIYRASHLLSWKDNNGVVNKQWASVRGPVETKAKYDNVSGEYLGGRQNDTIEIFIGAKDVNAISALERYDKIKIATRTWRIQVRDDISNPSILRLSCIENFNNDYTDDVINAIPDGMIEFPENVTTPIDNIVIVGENTIKEQFSKVFVAKIDEVPVVGDFKVYQNGVEISSSLNVSEVKVQGGKLGDIMMIRFYQEGLLKASVEVPVVSIFG